MFMGARSLVARRSLQKPLTAAARVGFLSLSSVFQFFTCLSLEFFRAEMFDDSAIEWICHKG